MARFEVVQSLTKMDEYTLTRGGLRDTHLVPVTKRNRTRVGSAFFAGRSRGEVAASRIHGAAFLLFADLFKEKK